MAASEQAMREAYSAWLADVESGLIPLTVGGYILWRAWDDNLPCRLQSGQVVALLDDAVEAMDERQLVISRVRHILSSGYGCTGCAQDDLRQAVGLDPVPDTVPSRHQHL